MKKLKFERKETKKQQSAGITLIALVITIIVLLILAGISISMLSGDNSILQKTTEAKQTSERAEAKEQAKIDIMAWITDKTANHEDASLDDTKVREILNDNKSYVKEAKESSFITAKGEYEILYSELYGSENKASAIDWEQIKANATKHPKQSETNLDIGIGTDGNPVNLDLWSYTVINKNEIVLAYDGDYGFEYGYEDSNMIDGKIQGKVPQFIKINGNTDFYTVTSMQSTFEDSEALVEAPEIPNTVTNLDQTFFNCSNLISVPELPNSIISMMQTFGGCEKLVKAPKIPGNVTNMSTTFSHCTNLKSAPIIPTNVRKIDGCFFQCRNLTGELIINANFENYSEYEKCLYDVSTNEGISLKLTGTSNKLNEILATKTNDSNISLKD